ncbi:hypothetical protein E2C01_063489 [Portunus trituberculatus]|uniref:Uncharacterized protein n=1 Tax=Portunus trituberculatus TaxID=210409 RepID=A0A5B7H9A4_PORTR|nr:hypothetical protein [Portunus trituberculatus]
MAYVLKRANFSIITKLGAKVVCLSLYCGPASLPSHSHGWKYTEVRLSDGWRGSSRSADACWPWGGCETQLEDVAMKTRERRCCGNQMKIDVLYFSRSHSITQIANQNYHIKSTSAINNVLFECK